MAPIHDVGPVAEDWRSRGAHPLSGTTADTLVRAQGVLALEAARLSDLAARAGAGPEVQRESEACAEAAGTLARLIQRRGVERGPGGVR